MKTCKGCKWAQWDRTANGRLHPNGQGKCMFPIKIPPIPAMAHYSTREAVRVFERNVGCTGFIERNRELRDHCPTYAPEGA